MQYLYLIRHGVTDLNEKGVYYGRIDCDLNSKGIRQSYLLKNKMSKICFDEVVSSPMKRCIQTAEIITANKITLESKLVEIDFGLWEGLDFETIKVQYPMEWEKWCNDFKDTAPPGGESFAKMFKRVKEYVTGDLLQKNTNKIVVVAHKGCLQAIASILLCQNETLFWNFTFDHGKYSLFEINQGHCTIKKMNC
ncbi:alpha-ribazole phosphatase [Proteinivorax tanatarense]|uniref:Alpha-ribazole phosphatase n=1 Tax=Proteinivorax tanatarense TaxID=1260629 RepID=A0AAU7VIX9_9FIRM